MHSHALVVVYLFLYANFSNMLLFTCMLMIRVHSGFRRFFHQYRKLEPSWSYRRCCRRLLQLSNELSYVITLITYYSCSSYHIIMIIIIITITIIFFCFSNYLFSCFVIVACYLLILHGIKTTIFFLLL